VWILKGALLSICLFGFGTVVFSTSVCTVMRPHLSHLRPGEAVGLDERSIGLLTTLNPLWWTALVVCLVLGLVIARSWRGPLVLWIALLVTGLIPAGLLTLFITVLVFKFKQP
jgi:hypothetical protein